MRKSTAILRVLVVLIAVLTAAASTALAQDPVRKVLCSLEPGETIMNAESFLTLTAEADNVILVTTKGKPDQGPYFVHRAGARKGPFKELMAAMEAAYGDREIPSGNRRDCAAYSPGPAPEGAEPELAEAEGGQTLKFKGKTLGPRMMFFSHTVTPDGALVYATAADNDKAWFESSDGRKASFGGTPGEFKFSPNGRNAAVLVQGSFSMNDMNNLAKLPPEKMAEALKNMDKMYLVTIDGKKYGPFDSFGSHSFWYAKTSNDLYFRAGDQVFRNGSPMMKIDSFDSCNFYPAPDGKSYALADYSNITFSDGKKFPSPLDVIAYQDKGKTVFKWIALENNKDLVVYQRAF